jgi:YidC/Oxa1 family membrane protein insertase
MDKRLLLAVGLSMGVLFLWWKIFPQPGQQPPAPAPAAQQQTSSPTTAGAPHTDTKAASGDQGAAAPTGNVAMARGPEQLVSLENRDVRFVLSSWGGTVRQVKLKDRKYQARPKEDKKGLDDVVRTTSPETAPLQLSFPNSSLGRSDKAAWTVSRPGPDAVTFRTETAEAVIEKRYRIQPDSHQLALEVVVRNKLERPANLTLAVHIFGQQNPDTKGGSFLDYAAANTAQMVCMVGDKVHRESVEELQKEAKTHTGSIPWVAADEKFVTLALVPQENPQGQARTCVQKSADGNVGELVYTLAPRSVPAGGETTYAFTLYGGPKFRGDLDAVKIGGADAQLGELVDVTFQVLSRPLLYLLKAFHTFTNNWGLAIILLTIFVKLVTFYPTWRTMLSAKKMQRLGPQLAVIRKKYENDRQKQGVETMNLYRQNGVSPFGGCLPSLIQMPIWIALFSTLNYAVELHRAPFLYIHDLSAKDPLYVAPLLMGVIMFLQMRMSPAGVDPQQQKMMAIMMPIMFTGFSLFLPAGLAIYTLTSYFIGILQQLLVNWQDRRTGGLPAKA